jgi:hypothetical protein
LVFCVVIIVEFSYYGAQSCHRVLISLDWNRRILLMILRVKGRSCLPLLIKRWIISLFKYICWQSEPRGTQSSYIDRNNRANKIEYRDSRYGLLLKIREFTIERWRGIPFRKSQRQITIGSLSDPPRIRQFERKYHPLQQRSVSPLLLRGFYAHAC